MNWLPPRLTSAAPASLAIWQPPERSDLAESFCNISFENPWLWGSHAIHTVVVVKSVSNQKSYGATTSTESSEQSYLQGTILEVQLQYRLACDRLLS